MVALLEQRVRKQFGSYQLIHCFLFRMVPRKVSSYMLLTGIPIDSVDALRSGLVSRLSETDEALEKEIDTVCDAIAIKPKKVVELGKAFYRRQIEMGNCQNVST